MRLRDFSTGRDDGQPALICAPYALHGATIADFAPGHSIVEALRVSGLARLAITEWRSAEPDMRYFSIDTYLADLNVAVDELGAPVDLIGLCQGGWMALVYAARFPEKVRRLVLVGAPVDVRAAQSLLMQAVDELPLSTFENLVRLGEGRVLGRYALKLWGSASAVDDVARILQIAPGERDVRLEALKKHFTVWHAWTVDLPGVYYMQVVQKVFKDNQIAEGRFVALGSTVDLRTAGMTRSSIRSNSSLLSGLHRHLAAVSRKRPRHAGISDCSWAPIPSQAPGRGSRAGFRGISAWRWRPERGAPRYWDFVTQLSPIFT
jgi:poly(3-hydroxyalkanoate) synthetase